jgi:hypothetical protein
MVWKRLTDHDHYMHVKKAVGVGRECPVVFVTPSCVLSFRAAALENNVCTQSIQSTLHNSCCSSSTVSSTATRGSKRIVLADTATWRT